jgi:ferredoxin/flavodoxin---NADP+ reductase
MDSPAAPSPVAVVGSGPSGFYAAEALLKQNETPVRVDMFDRLPTPYGLVRGGVAPDHQKIKAVTSLYEKIAAHPAFRFFGNVRIGRDVSAADLEAFYPQIVYAVGNETDRRLGIPGEDLPGCCAATAFVGWYNGHPDFKDERFDLSCDSAAVIGIGNVAMDVARILARDPAELKGTDIADSALEALKASRVKTVYLLGRRGPGQAAYSPPEIKEIGSLSAADLVVRPEEAAMDEAALAALADPQARKCAEYTAQKAADGEGSKARKIRLRFCVSPVEVLAQDGRAAGLRLEKNRLVPNGRGGLKAEGAGRFEEIPAGLILKSVGYRGVPLPGVPFDEKSGRIPNADGRVTDATGAVLPGRYVVGWAKRGPTGLVGTNKPDAAAVVRLMLEDAAARRLPRAARGAQDVSDLLRERGVRAVTFSDWKTLDRLERESGAAAGKVRRKFTTVAEMLSALDEAPRPA